MAFNSFADVDVLLYELRVGFRTPNLLNSDGISIASVVSCVYYTSRALSDGILEYIVLYNEVGIRRRR